MILAAILILCKLEGQDVKIIFGIHHFWIQHAQIDLKSHRYRFSSHLHLRCLHFRNRPFYSTLIRQRCDNIPKWCMKLTFINSERWLQNVICTQGLSLILVVLFSIYTEIETLFSFISIIKMISVCDRRYLEKLVHIVCWGVYVIDPVWESSFVSLWVW